MPLALWIDGVLVNQDLTEELYRAYSGDPVDLSLRGETFEDIGPLLQFLRTRRYAILSPFTRDETMKVMKSLSLEPQLVVVREDTIKTKPSGEPVKALLARTDWDPMKTVVIGSSPLDLLSVRYSDSRIKVACLRRFADCSVYSPFIQASTVESLVKSLLRLRLG
ncbi:hypothetical protein MetMK1DRAFT_00006410 [Metallosphaera yellowstonensis MK1]|jgi:phosphoglycolate phosphatase-like HAD superfamily hydrolase|uniref:HAD family hydrolase n=1 Tax=Metallosphaera yellowstonensis MK1 TaxID=671065 RepID=H2C1L8_9CREN|nr:HAD hydrolase-like protein [Metallosphaera yellowstonensis]EHP70139.1 hypothetical protein MetMK1DRAFT_00006410 [Metallosphaera yellowstonensis MK1]